MRRASCEAWNAVKGISIHAPLAGCDCFHLLPHRASSGFQSTHPLRGATKAIVKIEKLMKISIHAPLAGCDKTDYGSNAGAGISIHAPLAGCDDAFARRAGGQVYFNPRTPCGVRLNPNTGQEEIKIFQSTHPLRGATEPEKAYSAKIIDFNPRTPCGVRQQNCRNIPGKFAQKLQNFCKAKQRAALPRVGQRESSRYFRPCAVRTSRGKPERFRFASDNERALRSVARLCAEVLDAGFILVSKVIKA